MKEQIIDIAEKLFKQEIQTSEAQTLLLDLFNASNRRELLIDFAEFISNIYDLNIADEVEVDDFLNQYK